MTGPAAAVTMLLPFSLGVMMLVSLAFVPPLVLFVVGLALRRPVMWGIGLALGVVTATLVFGAVTLRM